MWRSAILVVVVILIAVAGDRDLVRPAGAAEALELSQEDRAAIEKYLGKGVVGKAVPGNPIADAAKFFAFEDGAWEFQFTSGDDEGKTQAQSFKKLERDDTGTKGRYQNGPDLTYFLHRSEDGSINVTSEQDQDHGVISRFSPPEPIYVSGMKPGDSKQTKIDVKVYDLSDLKDVSHEGSLDLTYSFIGAYEVTVPAGTFEAALIKWDYKGEVGPASIEDTQYRFLAEGAGVVAMVEKKNISAVLIYHDESKYGKVLVKGN
jgi:hypothetical protein